MVFRTEIWSEFLRTNDLTHLFLQLEWVLNSTLCQTKLNCIGAVNLHPCQRHESPEFAWKSAQIVSSACMGNKAEADFIKCNFRALLD